MLEERAGGASQRRPCQQCCQVFLPSQGPAGAQGREREAFWTEGGGSEGRNGTLPKLQTQQLGERTERAWSLTFEKKENI